MRAAPPRLLIGTTRSRTHISWGMKSRARMISSDAGPEPGDEIEVRCRCGHRDIRTRRHDDPPGALWATTCSCPECRGRKSADIVFYDAAGRRLG
jgi:hypothetical protein